MKYSNHITELIGHTPLVKINNITKNVKGTILAKIESFNPGHSIKDRIGLQLIKDAEKKGLLKSGGTIIEATSGNTGMGLALIAIQRGYKLICTMSDKQSKEKIDILKAMGAKVHICPTNVTPDHPDSYYSVAKKLNSKIPKSFYPNQYDNLSNKKAHYLTTGPEIWEQTKGKITHFVAGVGTGGTISGTAKFLKEKNKKIQVWGIDPYGSVFKKYHETKIFDEKEIYPYMTEGIGEDIIPKNVDFELIDLFEKVSDKNAALMTRELAKKEGILAGYSCGAALSGLIQLKNRLKESDVVVIILPDHGSRYLAKIFNDDWMKKNNFL
jgi:cystathionine beta-synthase